MSNVEGKSRLKAFDESIFEIGSRFDLGLRSVAFEAFVFIAEIDRARGVTPGSEVVLIDYHHVPIDQVQAFVSDLGLAPVVVAENVLERGEPNEGARIVKVGLGVLFALEAPTGEVFVTLEVLTPRLFDGRLVGQRQDPRPTHGLS